MLLLAFVVTATLAGPAIPPGGTAQITLSLPAPQAITSGSLSVDLDPAVFDNITAVNVFSASGDQAGVANIQGRHFDIEFTSPSGGIGRLPLHPVLQLTVPVLSTARPGITGAITAKAETPWHDLAGQQHTMTFQSPGIAIGTGLSIQSVVPGCGPLPAGTRVQINGLGFSRETRLQLDSVAWSNLEFVNPRQLTFTLTGPADLTGKILQLSDPNGTQNRYYSALTPTNTRRPPRFPEGIQPIFPLTSQIGMPTNQIFALANPTTKPVVVVFEHTRVASRPSPPVRTSISLDAGAIYIGDHTDLLEGFVTITPASPIPIMALTPASNTLTGYTPYVPAMDRDNRLRWNLQPLDSPLVAPLRGNSFGWPPEPNEITVGTDDGNSWLTPGREQGVPVVTVNPAGLSPGVHNAVITVTTAGAAVPGLLINASLTITPHPVIVTDTTSLRVLALDSSANPSFHVTSDSGAVPITVRSSENWLSMKSSSARTPAAITATVVNAAAFRNGAVITVDGPGNSLTIPVDALDVRVVAPTELTFSTPVGSTAQMIRRINVAPTVRPITAQSATESGGPWLTTAMSNGPGVPGLNIAANPAGLSAGTYRGTTTVHSAPGAGLPLANPIVVSVTLVVWGSTTPAPTASPATVQLTAQSKGPGESERVRISTGTLALPFSIAVQTGDASDWLEAYETEAAALTPSTIVIATSGESLPPGLYRGKVVITSPPQTNNSVTIPVTLTVTPGIATPTGVPPLITSLVNAASLLPGPIAPGEIVSLFGVIGPDGNAGVNIGPSGKVNTISYGNRVLFNGVPAPLTYMSLTQINAVVPYEIAASPTATVELEMSGIRAPAWTVPVSPASPAIFSQSGTGQGAAAVLNQDNTRNTPANPAARGSIIQIFATGEGQTTPPGITGEITQSNIKSPMLNASARIGSIDAGVISATTAPNAIAGLFQMNVRIPADSPMGSVPLIIRVGNTSSPATARISIK